MRSAIVIWLKNRISTAINYPISTIGELLKKLFSQDFDHYYGLLIKQIQIFLENILKNTKNREILTALLDKILDAFLDKSVDEFIGTDIIQNTIAKITSNSLQDKKLQEKIFVIVQDFFNQVFTGDKKINEVVPESLINAVSFYIKSRLPGLVENVADWMNDPRIKDVIHKKIIQVLTDYVNNLNFLQSVVVGILGVEGKIEAKIPYFIERLTGEISELSKDNTFINYLEDKVEYFLDNFLDKSVSTLTNESGIPINKFLMFFKDIFDEIIKDPNRIKTFLNEMTIGLNFETKKLADFISDDEKTTMKSRILKTIFSYLSNEGGLDELMKFVKLRVDNFLFKHKIGSLQSLLNLKRATIVKLSKRGMKYFVFLVDRELPLILKSLDLEKMVRERIDSFPLDEVEDIILKIIKDQLKWINVFGALLGFLIGCIQLIFR
jgi:uncharacterized membrane protein YheB (UPF0754 family)